jgi:hypothetical protein
MRGFVFAPADKSENGKPTTSRVLDMFHVKPPWQAVVLKRCFAERTVDSRPMAGFRAGAFASHISYTTDKVCMRKSSDSCRILHEIHRNQTLFHAFCRPENNQG